MSTATYSARLIPDPIRGRVISLTRLLVLAAHSLGFLLAGFSLEFLGEQWTIGIFSVFLLVVLLACAASRKLAEV